MLRDLKAEARIARQLEPRKLTAKQLGVTKEFLRAFDRVLKMFKSGEVELLPAARGTALWSHFPYLPGKWFNMATWFHDCHTIHCIGGWCHKEMGAPKEEDWEDLFLAHGFTEEQFRQLEKLFFPPDYELGLYTVAQAIAAMESWRTTGKTVWQ